MTDDTATDPDSADEQPATTDDGPRTTLVASLEESMGKTAITLALAKHARDAGSTVGYMKPKGTRLQSNVGKTLDEDPMLARELLDLDAEMHDLEPVVYSPTFIDQAIRGREDPEGIGERVREAFENLSKDADHMFIEGGGRLEQGGIVDLTDADVAELLDAEVVLVAPYETVGDVDDVLAAAKDFGDRFGGVIFNAVSDAERDRLETEIAPFLEGRGVPVHGVLPREQTLAGVTVDDLADELGGQVLVEEGLENYVERFSVGAMGADSALRHFRRTKNAAVITGGDRADIHAAALEASGVKCLILTGGHRPSGAILGQAAKKGVPVVLAQTDTLRTVERAEEIVRSGRTRDAQTIETMATLLADHTDLEALR
ncbi:phosphotransacetylase family protein [Natrialbaceae archaeon A-CW2]|uniref:phosphotransacetylase family protein n=1 Tax=Natronosalvus amylolyticus TaxID=2961994 RepID=UPI0020C9689B|nr:phosphotransacetylase family protein [Natronosalvus amylolyticus]